MDAYMSYEERYRADQDLMAIHRNRIFQVLRAEFKNRQERMSGEERIKQAHLFFTSYPDGSVGHFIDWWTVWLPESSRWLQGTHAEFETHVDKYWSQEIEEDVQSGNLQHISDAEFEQWYHNMTQRSRRQAEMQRLFSSLRQWRRIDAALYQRHDQTAAQSLPVEPESREFPASVVPDPNQTIHLSSHELAAVQASLTTLTTATATVSTPAVPYICQFPDCDYRTVDKGHFNRHVSAKHLLGNVYVCPFDPQDCGSQAKKRTPEGSFYEARTDNFRRHLKDHHAEEDFESWAPERQRELMRKCKRRREDIGVSNSSSSSDGDGH